MERRTKLTLYLIAILIILVALFIFPQDRSHKSYFTTSINEKINLKNNSIEVNSEQLNQGSLVNITNKTVKLNFEEKNLSIEKISSDSDNLGITIGDEEINLKIEKETKIDLNSDGIYDLTLLYKESNNTDQLYIKSIDNKINLENISLTKSQYILTVVILVLLVFFLIYWILKTYIIPTISTKRAKETEKPSKIIEELLNDMRNTKDKDKQKELYDRAKNLYKYLDKDDQEKLKWLFK